LGNAHGDNLGFASARTGNDHDRAFDSFNGLSLSSVKLGKFTLKSLIGFGNHYAVSVAIFATIDQMEKATFAAGCFWSVEAAFRQIKGIKSTTVGYTGGTTKDPTYEEVCTGTTGHVEAVQVEFDPKLVSYQKLLEVFWQNHNPTQRDGQGLDIGNQYRSIIFYHSTEQQKIAQESKEELEASAYYHAPIVTEILPANPFYKAEDYHQQYLEKRGLSSCKL
jgi:peptide-methionine (S)-S-oxide reductase